MVLFDNETRLETKETNQRSELLNQIENIIAENGGQPFSFEPFHEVQATSEKFLTQQRRTRLGLGNSQQDMEREDAEKLKRLTDM
ncbi:hypothetical protein KI387_002519, partial [Taxus chinensis]